MNDESKLAGIRASIDEIDDQLLALISQRAALAERVAAIKRSNGETNSFYRPEREAQVLRRLVERNPGPLHRETVTRLFREIISACLALEQPLNIAYLGPEGTFTQAAALKHFGSAVRTTALPALDQVFREVEAGVCQYGVVPIENSIEGVISHTHDLLINSNLRICGEIELRIRQHLMSRAGSLAGIRRIYSHQQSLAQCRIWLDNNLAGVERLPTTSNAEAARRAAAENDAAAIAGESAAAVYDLPILRRNIEDEGDNTTRFMVIGRHDTQPSGRDKTTLIFSTPNKPGALYKMLVCFADHDVSLTRIESRPSRRGNWDYVFFVDVEGHLQDPSVVAAIRQLEQTAAMVKVLGSYPRAVL
ncbi:MAG: prephenate dehydratase [Gammaproteobacteria bacterium]|nr:MAG: prephenate dehydratase [Gammaproteobacteria bacterium]